jgi:hypothetical protein
MQKVVGSSPIIRSRATSTFGSKKWRSFLSGVLRARRAFASEAGAALNAVALDNDASGEHA